jgi:hypothetical protein
MRLVSALLLVFACLLLAQTPIGLGPGVLGAGLDKAFYWYTATPSGCSNTPAGGNCVGHNPGGDTMNYTAWFADASLLPVTTGLPIVGMMNDMGDTACPGSNFSIAQLAEFSWSTPLASRIYDINCMNGYGQGDNVPAGWHGHCMSGDAFSDPDCSWKASMPFVKNGKLYIQLYRAINSGAFNPHDLTMLESDDGGKTWRNPYTVAYGGSARADGDPPYCDSTAGGAGHPCVDGAHLDYFDTAHSGAHSSIMWKGAGLDNIEMREWWIVRYGQDGNYPAGAGVADGCDPTVYTCFFNGEVEGTIARVPNGSIMDISAWRYYTCPAITDTYRCDPAQSANWTATLANRTKVFKMRDYSYTDVVYLKEFKAYLMVGYASIGGSAFITAPSLFGPWTFVQRNTAIEPSSVALPGVGYTVVSTDPPHIKLTMIGTDKSSPGTIMGAPLLTQWDLVAGKRAVDPEGPRYLQIGRGPVNAGYIISDSHVPGSIPRKDIVWAFDMYDHGGNLTAPDNMIGFHDVANGSAFLFPCSNGCGWFYTGVLGQTNYGMTLGTEGPSTNYIGYNAHLSTVSHDSPQTIASGLAINSSNVLTGLTPQNIPAALQGNGSFTVAGVFRRNSGTTYYGTFWIVGNGTPGTSWGLQYTPSDGSHLQLGMGTYGDHWLYDSAFTLPAGNWYFIACTVQANGSAPIPHMWTGIGGALVDKIAGVSRTASSGSPSTAAPNVAAAPFTTGADSNASYASLFVYSRALSQAEIGLMYNTVKAKMAVRGVTLQ